MCSSTLIRIFNALIWAKWDERRHWRNFGFRRIVPGKIQGKSTSRQSSRDWKPNPHVVLCTLVVRLIKENLVWNSRPWASLIIINCDHPQIELQFTCTLWRNQRHQKSTASAGDGQIHLCKGNKCAQRIVHTSEVSSRTIMCKSTIPGITLGSNDKRNFNM